MTEDEEIVIALSTAIEASKAVIAMGIARPHVPGSALVMVGLGLLETSTSPAALSAWLYKLADKYADQAAEDQ